MNGVAADGTGHPDRSGGRGADGSGEYGTGADAAPGRTAGSSGVSVGVTISIGVSVLGIHGRDMFELLAAADLALYRAKESGRNQVCLFAQGDDGPSGGKGPSGPALAAAEPD